MMQLIVMTSDKYHHVLNQYFYLQNKYMGRDDVEPIICGFTYDDVVKGVCSRWDVPFYSIGKYEDFPANRWSDAMKRVLDNVAKGTFIFMLEDYLIARKVDMRAVRLLYNYANSHDDILKIDLAMDRLYSDIERFFFGLNTAFHLEYLDVIETPKGSQYQMSFWGGIFNKDNLLRALVPGETAQEVELNGTTRVSGMDNMRVFGTRQAPLLHGNIYQGGKFVGYKTDTWRVSDDDVLYMKSQGWVK